jgi:L-fuconolactonase
MHPTEPALEPDLPIIDPHHHLWLVPPVPQYRAYPIETLADERASSGHDIRSTVFVDCYRSYLEDGPSEFYPIGETRTIDAEASAAEAAGGKMKGLAAGIVSHADMGLGAQVEPVLRAHIAASPKRFRGIRHITPYHPGFTIFGMEGTPQLLRTEAFCEGAKCLGRLGLSFDSWVLFPQLADVAYLANAAPETTIILDHVGAPMALPGFSEEAADAVWRKGMAEVAACPNVVVKLGGLLMHQHGADVSGSEAAAAAMRHHILTAIDLFTPERCMFESNFPVDAVVISYGNMWNAFKRITADFTRAEREVMFAGTAARVYRLPAI